LWKQQEVRGNESSPVLWRAADIGADVPPDRAASSPVAASGLAANESAGAVGGKARVIVNSNRAFCVDLADGRILWSVPGGTRSSVAIRGNTMAVNTGREHTGLAVYRLTGTQPTLVCTAPCSDGEASPILTEGHVFAFGRQVSCVDLTSGRLAWTRPDGGADSSSAVLADGKLIDVGPGTLLLIRASPEKYELLARAKLNVAPYTSGAIAGTRLFLRLADRVACFDLAVPAGNAPAKQ
jgi:outer membrane protein assembly factor BamB